MHSRSGRVREKEGLLPNVWVGFAGNAFRSGAACRLSPQCGASLLGMATVRKGLLKKVTVQMDLPESATVREGLLE